MNKFLNVSPSPHILSSNSTTKIMLDVIIALIPAIIAGAIIFGPLTLVTIGVSVICCVLFEFIIRKILKRDNTIGDLSAVVTGILLALNLPPSIPIWMVIIGDLVAIVIVKQFFGGIGQNFVNPAIVGRITLMISFPSQMSSFSEPFAWKNGYDAISAATPLKALESGNVPSLGETFSNPNALNDLWNSFLGIKSGCIGEVCIAALLLGFIYLLIKKVISPTIPLIYIGTTMAICWIAGFNPIYTFLSGGLVLGAVFMATDYTTSPITFKGKVIFAIGLGIITSVIRIFGNMAEGVSFAIIIMNILVPHIDSLTIPKAFGTINKKAGEKNE